MNTAEQPEPRPASECIWYVLATIAGEPGTGTNPSQLEQIMQGNRHYWNGLMGERLILTAGIFETRLGKSLDLPALTEDDLNDIRAALDARGFEHSAIPALGSNIDFSGVIFPGMLSFQGFVFGGETNFDGARFDGPYCFFADVTFCGRVTFHGTEFSKTFFGDDMNFATTPSFRGAQFRDAALFRRSRFHGQAEFDGTHFFGSSSFSGCEFLDGVSFADTEFGGRADFRTAQFRGRTDFKMANFKRQVPEFFGATLNEQTAWFRSQWPEIPKEDDERRDQITRYQCLARLMNGLEKFSDQHLFFGKELQIQRRVERWSAATPMNWLYQYVCGYGRGVTRMAAIWIGHVILGAVLLCVANICESMEDKGLWPATREAFSDVHRAIAVSFGHAHGPLSLNGSFFKDWMADFPGWGWVGPVQTVLGVIILFFLLLAIRNRFRMR